MVWVSIYSISQPRWAPMEHLDAIFIGPWDLSISLGYPTPSPEPHPEVEKVIQDILQVTHGAGKKWCVPSLASSTFSCSFSAIYCTTGGHAAGRAKQGFDIVSRTIPCVIISLKGLYVDQCNKRCRCFDARTRRSIRHCGDAGLEAWKISP